MKFSIYRIKGHPTRFVWNSAFGQFFLDLDLKRMGCIANLCNAWGGYYTTNVVRKLSCVVPWMRIKRCFFFEKFFSFKRVGFLKLIFESFVLQFQHRYQWLKGRGCWVIWRKKKPKIYDHSWNFLKNCKNRSNYCKSGLKPWNWLKMGQNV